MQQHSEKRRHHRFLKTAFALLITLAFLFAPVSSASAGILEFFATPTPKPTSTPKPTPTPKSTPTPKPTPKPTLRPTAVPCPYGICTFNIDGRKVETYFISFGGMQQQDMVRHIDKKTDFGTMNGGYYSLIGEIHDCVGLRIVVDFETNKGKPNSVPWEPVVWLDREEKWTSGVMENEAHWDERDRYVGDLLFWEPASFSYVSCIPARKIKNAWSMTSWLGIERMYFSTPEAAMDYYNSVQ